MTVKNSDDAGDGMNQQFNVCEKVEVLIFYSDSSSSERLMMKLPYCLVLKQATVFFVKKLSHSWSSTLWNILIPYRRRFGRDL